MGGKKGKRKGKGERSGKARGKEGRKTGERRGRKRGKTGDEWNKGHRAKIGEKKGGKGEKCIGKGGEIRVKV